MRILILTYSYAPVANARALRWTTLAEEWVRHGHEITVVSAWLPGSRDNECVNGVVVHRAGMRLLEGLRAKLAAHRTSSMQSLERTGTRVHRSLFDAVPNLLAAKAWRSVYWPDTSCLWFLPGLRRARILLRDMWPDAVVSVSPTFTAVLIGMRLLSGLPRRPRWLLDLGDPFSFAEEAPPNNFRLYRRLNLQVERAAFRHADAVCVTTEETRARYAAMFGEAAGKIEVIPPLVSHVGAAACEEGGDGISLVYVGTLYRSIRGPEFMLALFRRLLDRPVGAHLQLHFYGDVRDCRPSFERHAELLGRSVFVHGAVPRDKAVAVMRRASVLVNLGNRTSYQLPSKVVEYAALGRPILNIAGTADDSSARFLRTYPRCLTVFAVGATPSNAQLSSCERFLEEAANRRLAPVPSGWVAPFALKHISERYLSLLSR